MPNKTVLVAGTARPFNAVATRAARMVGLTLVENGFNLVTGNAPGVDAAAAAAFCFERQRLQLDHDTSRGTSTERDRDPPGYLQLRLPFLNRGSLLPLRSYHAARENTHRLSNTQDWLEEARARADAAVILGGHQGAMAIVNRFIDCGKPVFPVPFTGGHSNEVFREILRNWCDNPVPGLSRAQFLQLAIPWISSTGALADLLLGTLSEHPDIFISYRRADSDWITSRLRSDLAERFGSRRVFMDVQHIQPGQVWRDVIDMAVRHCQVGVVVITANWFDRLAPADGSPAKRDQDVLRYEIRALIDHGKPIIPVLTPDAPADRLQQLPDDLMGLGSRQALVITPSGWEIVLEQIVRTIRPLLRRGRSRAQPSLPEAATS